MRKTLFYNTVTPELLTVLRKLMDYELLNDFRLVGGTSLSLRFGHRRSADIDLFTDAIYDTIDYEALDRCFRKDFNYVDTVKTEIAAMGKSYYLGESRFNCVKVDLFYTDTFIRPVIVNDFIRMSDPDDVVAMKMDVIARGGRKKDFWDIHELLDQYTIESMIQLHEERYPYSHDRQTLLSGLKNFEQADSDFDPICLRGKHWELIKLDIYNLVNTIN